MAQEQYELHGVYEAVSVSSRGMSNDSPRDISLWERPGGNWDQTGSVHGKEISGLPDGRDLAPGEKASYGFEDDELYAVYIKGDVATVAYHDTP